MSEQASMQRFQALQQQLQRYDQHLAFLEQTIAELRTALTTIEGIRGDAVLETQVPIGAGTRIMATVDPAAAIFMDLGAGYSTELSAADALTRLRDRLTSTESSFRSASAEADKVARSLQALQAELGVS